VAFTTTKTESSILLITLINLATDIRCDLENYWDLANKLPPVKRITLVWDKEGNFLARSANLPTGLYILPS